jgi:hypothetical protein
MAKGNPALNEVAEIFLWLGVALLAYEILAAFSSGISTGTPQVSFNGLTAAAGGVTTIGPSPTWIATAQSNTLLDTSAALGLGATPSLLNYSAYGPAPVDLSGFSQGTL